VALASLLGTWSVSWATGLGLVIVAVVLLRRRWFCRWMCPTGLLTEQTGRLGRRFGRRCPSVPSAGQWIACITLGGALLGYPVFLWLDPLALLAGPFGLLANVTGAAIWWTASGLLIVLLLSMIWPGLWCHRLCPLGATQDLLVRLSPVAGRMRSGAGQPAAGEVAEPVARPSAAAANSGMSRRAALGALAGVGWAAAARPLHGQVPPPLRPPGALEDVEFAGMCLRCGNCIRACPANIIRPDLLEHGLAGFLAPVVRFDGDYCREDCTRCAAVCPSGALRPLRLTDKPTVLMGVARVNLDLCVLLDNRECWACRNYCPYDAVSFVWSDDVYTLTPVVDADKCPGCGACELACPTQPEKAILIYPRNQSPPSGAAGGS
jgi:ferredoxin-type protein NapF